MRSTLKNGIQCYTVEENKTEQLQWQLHTSLGVSLLCFSRLCRCCYLLPSGNASFLFLSLLLPQLLLLHLKTFLRIAIHVDRSGHLG